MKKLLFLVSFFPVLALATNASKVDCQTYDSDILQKHVRYCIQRSDGDLESHANEPVIYFFHGMGGTSANWEEAKYNEAFEELAKSENLPRVTAISFDTDETSFFSDYANQPTGHQAYETWFIKEFMPKMEKEQGVCNRRECRATAGVSMGGFGALKTALKYPDLFFTAAANCPALPPFSIYESDQKWTDYFNRHPIGALQGSFLLSGIRQIFPSEEVYQENNPITLVQKNGTDPTKMQLYFDVGGKDEYGFQEGHQALKDALDKTQIKYTAFLDPDAGHDIYKTRRWDLLRYLKDRFSTPVVH